MQRQGLESAQVELQRRVLFLELGIARLLKFHVSFGPALFAVKNNSIPKGVASRQLLGLGLGCQPEWLVNFVPLAGIHAAEKIDWARDNIAAGQLKRARTDQNTRTIKAVGDT